MKFYAKNRQKTSKDAVLIFCNRFRVFYDLLVFDRLLVKIQHVDVIEESDEQKQNAKNQQTFDMGTRIGFVQQIVVITSFYIGLYSIFRTSHFLTVFIKSAVFGFQSGGDPF